MGHIARKANRNRIRNLKIERDKRIRLATAQEKIRKAKHAQSQRQSISGTAGGRDLARARARRMGKIAVFSKDEAGNEVSTAMSSAEIEAQRRVNVDKAERDIKTKPDEPQDGDEDGEASQLTTTTDADSEQVSALQGGGLLDRAKDLLGNVAEATDLEKITGEELATGIIPVGPGGGLGLGKELVQKGKGIASLAKASSDKIKIAGKSIKRFPATNDEMIAYGKQVIKANRKGKFGKFGKGGTALAALWATNEFILSPSELATWAAVDNIAGVTGFQVKNIVDGVKWEGMDADVAQERIDEAKQTIANAESYVNLATMLNPKMWGPRKQMLGAIKVAKIGVLDQEIRLNVLKGGN
jgi:hypothetical protein